MGLSRSDLVIGRVERKLGGLSEAIGPSLEKWMLRSRRVVFADGVRPACIEVERGVIVGLADWSSFVDRRGNEDLGDAVLLPGAIDPHVHVNEPGRTEWEGFHSATRAAAAGGITVIGDMPLNCDPVTVDRASLEAKRGAARGKMQVDCLFYGGLVEGGASSMSELARGGVVAVKAFLVDSGLDEFRPAGVSDLRAALPVLSKARIPLLVHAELPTAGPPAVSELGVSEPNWDWGQVLNLRQRGRERIKQKMSAPRSYAAYLRSRPEAWELRAIRLLVEMCREFDCHIHIVHLSSAQSVPLLRQARSEGLRLSVETCPHYLTFFSEEIEDGDTRFKCAPPIRSAANRERLWEAMESGDIDLIASDHSPCPPSLKYLGGGDFGAAWGGIASLELLLPALWTEASRRGHQITDLARWTSAAPAQMLGLKRRKGAIRDGVDADLVVFDPDAEWVVRGKDLQHRHPVTPYEGRLLSGRVLRTYLRGRKVFERGEFGPPCGREIRSDDRRGIVG